jgi:hypothetical protein
MYVLELYLAYKHSLSLTVKVERPAVTDNRDPGSLLYNLPYTTRQADRSKTKQVRPVYYALHVLPYSGNPNG